MLDWVLFWLVLAAGVIGGPILMLWLARSMERRVREPLDRLREHGRALADARSNAPRVPHLRVLP